MGPQTSYEMSTSYVNCTHILEVILCLLASFSPMHAFMHAEELEPGPHAGQGASLCVCESIFHGIFLLRYQQALLFKKFDFSVFHFQIRDTQPNNMNAHFYIHPLHSSYYIYILSVVFYHTYVFCYNPKARIVLIIHTSK